MTSYDIVKSATSVALGVAFNVQDPSRSKIYEDFLGIVSIPVYVVYVSEAVM